jgi:rsbT co-antagonist protein RsbR
MPESTSTLSQIIIKFEQELLAEWLKGLLSNITRRDSNIEKELERSCSQFLNALKTAASDSSQGIEGRAWEEIRGLLTEISRARVKQGFSPMETANFVFSLKQPLFAKLRIALADKPTELADETWNVSSTLEKRTGLALDWYARQRKNSSRNGKPVTKNHRHRRCDRNH